MIILDTNVLSEVTSSRPSVRVTAWVDSQFDEMFITAITVGELSYGIAKLPPSRRRRQFADQLARILTQHFSERILPFDEAAALEFGPIVADRKARGRLVSTLDAQIAAIAVANDAVVATRDARGLDHPGLVVVNPWDA